MKKYIYLILSFLFIITACSDKWDQYYHGETNSSEETLNQTLIEFLEEHEEYSEYYNLLKACRLDTVLQMNQQLTLWVVENEGIVASGIMPTDTLRVKYHMNFLPFLRTDLKDGLRIRSLNEVYLQIAKTSDEDIYVNRAKVEKSYRLKNGVIHVIDDVLLSRINMFDFISQLPEEFSIFRDSVMFYNEERFDRENSKQTGVDPTGNAVYDSLFYIYNPIFEEAEFNSEFKQFTAFIPSNKVIEGCFEKLSTQFASMGKTVSQEDSIKAFTWIKEAAFYEGTISDFSVTDLKSSFGRMWRNTIQKVDQSNAVELSNGLLYYITDFKIPTNYILTRIKSLVEYWQYLSEEEKVSNPDFYLYENSTLKIVDFDDTKKPHILPRYYLLQATVVEGAPGYPSVEFPPLEKYEDGNNIRARVMSVPTGEYDLHMGFRSSAHPYVNIYFNGERIGTNIAANLSTPWNYDRVNETTADLYGDNVDKWDGIGGYVGTVRIGEEGEAGMSSFRIKVEVNKPQYEGTSVNLQIYHWVLKPSNSNY